MAKDTGALLGGAASVLIRDESAFAKKQVDTVLKAAMRKLLHIAFGVLKSGHPFDPNLALA